MRDLSRAAGMSLAGLYHYFESKEDLLYLIQKHTFRTIIERLQERLKNPVTRKSACASLLRTTWNIFWRTKRP